MGETRRQTRPPQLGIVIGLAVMGLLSAPCGGGGGSKSASGGRTLRVTAVTPDIGDVSGGTQVIVITADFEDDFTLDLPEVYFGSDPGTVSPLGTNAVLALTPPHALVEAVDVEVRATGAAETATLAAGFSYTDDPCIITRIIPSQGAMAGGETVLIDGSGFDTPPQPAPTVEFGPGNPSPSVTVLPSGQLEVVTPGGTPGVVDVIITTQAGSCTRPGGFEYLAPIPCAVSAANPRQGFMDRATTVTLTGTDFDLPPLPAPTVEFGPGNFGTVLSVLPGDLIEVDAPVSTTMGPVDVIVTNQGTQCTLPGGFEYVAPPPTPSCTITSLDPAFGPDFGATNITIRGTDFTVGTRVWIGAAEVTPVLFRSDTEIQVKAPPGTGTVAVTVDIGGGRTCLSSFDYITCTGPACTLQRATPNRANPGDLVTVSGGVFEQGAQVFFGDAPDLAQATIFDDSGLPTDLVVIVPPQAGPDPTVDIHVVNPSGACCTRGNGFTYASCLLESALPDFGPPGGNSTVLITGTDFPALGGPLPEVWFGTEQCSFVERLSQTQVRVFTPPSAGQTAVEVKVIFSTGETCSYCCYTFFPGCVIDSIVADSGGTNGGDLLTITGWGFEPNITIGGMGACAPVSPTILFDAVWPDLGHISIDPTGTVITLLAPSSFTGGPKDVVITNWLFGTQCSGTFTYILPGARSCSITDIDPDGGYACAQYVDEQWVTIRGDGFDANTGVLFGIDPSPQVIFTSPQELQVLAPDNPHDLDSTGAPTPVDVVVAPENSDPCILPGGFTYGIHGCEDAACSIAGASPSSGPVAGGNTITITGSDFCDPDYRPPPNPPGWIDIFFGSEVVRATYVDETTLTVVVPPSVTGPGPVDLVHLDATGCANFCAGCYTYN